MQRFLMSRVGVVGGKSAHLLRHELALVHDGVGGERADVGMLVVIALAVPLVLNQLAQDVELHPRHPSNTISHSIMSSSGGL